MQGFSIHVHTNPIDGYGRGVIQQHKAPQMQLISQPPSNQQNISQGTKFIKNFVIDYSKKIGQGNFSCVYTAIDQRQPNQRLAVKVVNMQQLRQQSLQFLIKSEVDVLLFMRHQNVIYCKDVCYDQTFCYIFTQFCEGGSLESKIQNLQPKHDNNIGNTKPLYHHFGQAGHQNLDNPFLTNPNGFQIPNVTEHQMLPYIRDIFQAMLYLQRSHIVHRDIKAANIFIKENRAIVADFGFAKFFNEPFTDLNIGSLPYMPPQAIAQSLYSNKTDVWAFGVTVFQLFHGESPYAKSVDLNQLIQKTMTPLNISLFRPDLSVQIKELILNCLEPDMQKRKKFSQLQKMWYTRKLFQNIGQYSYVYRANYDKNNSNQKLSPKNFLTVQRQNRLTNQRTFSSKFKDKINIGNGAKFMNYNDENPIMLSPTVIINSVNNQNNKFNLSQPQSQNQNQNYMINSPTLKPTNSLTQNPNPNMIYPPPSINTNRGVSPQNGQNTPRSVGKPQNQSYEQVKVSNVGSSSTSVTGTSNVNNATNNQGVKKQGSNININPNTNPNTNPTIKNPYNPTTPNNPPTNTTLHQNPPTIPLQQPQQPPVITPTLPTPTIPINSSNSLNTNMNMNNPTLPVSSPNIVVKSNSNQTPVKQLTSLSGMKNKIFQYAKEQYENSPLAVSKKNSYQGKEKMPMEGNMQGQPVMQQQQQQQQPPLQRAKTPLRAPPGYHQIQQFQSLNSQNPQNPPKIAIHSSNSLNPNYNQPPVPLSRNGSSSDINDQLAKSKSVDQSIVSPTMPLGIQNKNFLKQLQQSRKAQQQYSNTMTNINVKQLQNVEGQRNSNPTVNVNNYNTNTSTSINIQQKKSQTKQKNTQKTQQPEQKPLQAPPSKPKSSQISSSQKQQNKTPAPLKNSPIPKQRQITSFKDILLSIQQIRNYYKLAIILKDRNKRLSQIKNRLFMKAVKQISKVYNIVENDKVDLSAYDKNNSFSKMPDKKEEIQQQQTNILNRKNKLLAIIKDYKIEFENQLKRRQISPETMDWTASLYSYNSLTNQKEIFQNSSYKPPNQNIPQQSFYPNSAKLPSNFKSKTFTLSQDIEYVVHNEISQTVQDTPYMSFEQAQNYKNKLKDVLEDIMHVQHGFLSSMYSKNVQDRGYNSYGNGGAVVSTSYRNMKNPLPGGTTTPIPTTAANLKKNISNASTTPNISINTSTNLGYVESFTNNNNNNNTNTNLNSDKNSNSTPSNTSNPTTSIPLTTTSAPKNKNSQEDTDQLTKIKWKIKNNGI